MASSSSSPPQASKINDEWSFAVQRRIAWGEMDANGHMNNIWYFRWTEDCRVEFLVKAFPGLFSPESPHGLVVAEQSCRYIRPIVWPDNAKIYSRISNLSSSSIFFDYLIYSEKLGPAATGTARIAVIDKATGKKAEIPSEIRQTAEDYEAKNRKPRALVTPFLTDSSTSSVAHQQSKL